MSLTGHETASFGDIFAVDYEKIGIVRDLKRGQRKQKSFKSGLSDNVSDCYDSHFVDGRGSILLKTSAVPFVL
jgi:hypothetical protein